jgi:hypothetical protein
MKKSDQHNFSVVVVVVMVVVVDGDINVEYGVAKETKKYIM